MKIYNHVWINMNIDVFFSPTIVNSSSVLTEETKIQLLIQFFSIALAQFLKQKLHSQSFKCIWQNIYGSAQLHRSPSKGNISPKTVNYNNVLI